MRIPITSTTNSLLPVKRYFASATAARNATTIERATTAPTTIRLFFTTSQKYGRAMASRKCCNVGWIENHVGEDEWISVSGLNAVEIIQNTGKTNTRKTARPTTFQTARRRRRLRARRIEAARGVARATGGAPAATSLTALIAPPPSSPCAARRRCSARRR
jgi:hypothetical protein